ncbi:MAG: tRNA glutamyl-Q synthetase [Verrucomicrobia bacterium]|nr:tRNA glutamyl-Q synthetase [Verrucomicrobiota bacterium]
MLEDLRWLGFHWDEGPDIGGPLGPYNQSERRSFYRSALEKLHAANLIFPCTRSRRDVLDAARAPHEASRELDEPIYPPQFRPPSDTPLPPLGDVINVNWRLRVPDSETLTFDDGYFGPQQAIVGRDFGDFLVWRKDDTPSYQLACVVDDAAMQITEVVRSRPDSFDLPPNPAVSSSCYTAPAFYHCPLMVDDKGVRLAKRHDALSLRAMRESGKPPGEILRNFNLELRKAGTENPK